MSEEYGATGAGKKQDVHKVRRKLSVLGDSALIDGIESLDIDKENTEHNRKNIDNEISCAVAAYAGCSKKGITPYNPRKKNQDALLMAEDKETGTLMFVVLDGHGEFGDHVSQQIKSELAKNVFEHPDFVNDPRKAMTECIANAEQSCILDPTINTDYSGTTLVAALIRNTDLLIFNIGDSRITLGYLNEDGKVDAEPLSEDHKPDLPTEKERILAAGGRVFAVEYDDGVDGPPRVWLGHMDVPGLAMARSLGDAIAHTAGVSSEPEVFELSLDDDNALFLVMATDGLWEFMTDKEVVDLVSPLKDPQLAVDILIKDSHNRWLQEEEVVDDTTVLVAFLSAYKAKPI